jgi:hypothetical protein
VIRQRQCFLHIRIILIDQIFISQT